ncbi:hypothetical protein L6251_02190 [Candidatus Parcubacteria bacterium]|nr:hypothetical protein [Patescibacteria group bacterium]MBU4477278.1 hypothetical protein [Patescibacteria group bacterium]MCG2699209.1 hypothetical protein [Candidatus Parcubacteria bacterium]
MAKQQQGFIKIVFLIVLLIIILSYFNIDIRTFFESEIFKKNFNYVWNGIKDFWTDYLQRPAGFIWNFIKESASVLIKSRQK